MSNPDDAEPGLLEDWQRHPFTAMTLKTLKAEEENYHKALLGMCAHTADPKVAAAYHQWKSTARIVSAFGGEPLKKRRA